MAREGKPGRTFGRRFVILFFAFIVLILGVWAYMQWSGAEGVKWANLPVLSPLLNEPSEDSDSDDGQSGEDRTQVQNEQEKIAKLQRSLRAKDEEISSLTDEVATLEQQLDAEESETPQNREQAYRDVAKMYADMKPERAAAILSQLENAEAVRILSEQKSETAAAILERMETEQAATLTVLLSDGNR